MAYFAKFTERAQRALIAAQREAAQLGRDYVGTEHLLLGVLTDPGAAGTVLKGITLDAVRAQIVEMLGSGDNSQAVKTLVYTPRTKKVLELSVREARELKQNYVGTEHILLALMREREGVAAQLLARMGMDLTKAREELLRALNGSDENTAANTKKQDVETPILDQFARDLTKAAQGGELDPVIGRAKEIERIVQILSRRTKNNPVLIGEPGVGKSAIVEGLAQLIVEGNIPEILRGKRVVALDLASMLAGAKYRGEFEERLKNAMAEIRKAGNVVLFIAVGSGLEGDVAAADFHGHVARGVADFNGGGEQFFFRIGEDVLAAGTDQREVAAVEFQFRQIAVEVFHHFVADRQQFRREKSRGAAELEAERGDLAGHHLVFTFAGILVVHALRIAGKAGESLRNLHIQGCIFMQICSAASQFDRITGQGRDQRLQLIKFRLPCFVGREDVRCVPGVFCGDFTALRNSFDFSHILPPESVFVKIF